MSEAARAEFTPTAQVKDDFVVTVQQQAAPLIEETVPVDGRSRDPWPVLLFWPLFFFSARKKYMLTV